MKQYISRRSFLKSAAGFGALASVAGYSSLPGFAADAAAGAGKTGKPNILLILMDDLRADCIGALGNPHIHTPNIDRLVKDGTVFRNCFIMGSNSPAVCTPSRVMLMSGKTLFHLPSDIAAEGDKPVVPVMSTVLKAAGYDTFHYGKMGNVYRPASRAFDRSLDYKDCHKEFSEQSKEYGDRTVEYLREPDRAKRPFFVYLGPSVPHDPLYPSPEALAMYQGEKRPPLPPNAAASHKGVAGFSLMDTNVRTYDVPGLAKDKYLTPLNLEEWRDVMAQYYALVTTFDTQVGRILDELERTGLAKNTIVIFTSDNGHSLGDHGLIHKESIYDHDNRVPLIIRGPGIPAGGKRDTYVYLSDLFPTMCEWAGTPIPDTVETKSFKAAVVDPAGTHRAALYTAYRGESRSLRDDQYKIILYNVFRTEARYTQLFSIRDDPFETRNLASDPAQAERVARMTAQARQAGRELGDDVPDMSKNLKFWEEWDKRHPFGAGDVQSIPEKKQPGNLGPKKSLSGKS